MRVLRVTNKKGQGAINFLRLAILAMVIATITLTIALRVNSTVTDTMNEGANNTSHKFKPVCTNPNYTCVSAAHNASALGTTGLATFADYWSVIAIVIVLAVIIALFGIFGAGEVGVVIR